MRRGFPWLVLLLGSFFLLSALEVGFDENATSFGDPFDTYLSASPVTKVPPPAVSAPPLFSSPFLYPPAQLLVGLGLACCDGETWYFPPPSPRIRRYLWLAVFRI